jgi:hypothetical protein
MLEEKPALNDVQQLQINMFYKFLSDAANVLGHNPLPAAHESRCRIEEALMWGRLAISAFVIRQPTEEELKNAAATQSSENAAPVPSNEAEIAPAPAQEDAA